MDIENNCTVASMRAANTVRNSVHQCPTQFYNRQIVVPQLATSMHGGSTHFQIRSRNSLRFGDRVPDQAHACVERECTLPASCSLFRSRCFKGVAEY
jgi:hypothetical protein